jgi:hypothetical protein
MRFGHLVRCILLGPVITNCLQCIHRPQVEDAGDLRGGWAICKKSFDVQYWTGSQLTSSEIGVKGMSIVRDGSDCPLYDTGKYEGPRPTRFEKVSRDDYPL